MFNWESSCHQIIKGLLVVVGYCSDNTLLQVAQKRGSAIDKPKQGTTGTDIDSIRTAILEEAAIVWRVIFRINVIQSFSFSFPEYPLLFLCTFRCSLPLASVALHFLLNLIVVSMSL